jgi:hypothetical protein
VFKLPKIRAHQKLLPSYTKYNKAELLGLKVPASFAMKHMKKNGSHISFKILMFEHIATKEAYLLNYPAMAV